MSSSKAPEKVRQRAGGGRGRLAQRAAAPLQAQSIVPLLLGVGEATVCLVVSWLAAHTNTSTGRGHQLFAVRLVIAAASAVGAVRYGPLGALKGTHFFLRQFAQVLPITVMALSVVSLTVQDVPLVAAALAHEGSILLIALAAALGAFFTGNEAWGKLVQVPAFVALAVGVLRAVALHGVGGKWGWLAAGVAIFAVREAALRALLPLAVADPLRRFTLVAALLAFSQALG